MLLLLAGPPPEPLEVPLPRAVLGVRAGGWPTPPLSPLVSHRVQILERTATGGTVTLNYAGQTTATVPATAAGFTASAVQSALEGLSNLAPVDVAVTGAAGGPLTVTFGGALTGTVVARIVVNAASATGGTVTVDTVVPDFEFHVVNALTDTVKGVLANVLDGTSFEDVWGDAGSGSLSLMWDEPTGALIAEGDVIRCFYRGLAVYQWEVDEWDKATLPGSDAEEEQRIKTWSGVGRILDLGDADVAPSWGFDRTPVEDTRLSGWTSPTYDFDWFWPAAVEIAQQGWTDEQENWLAQNKVPALWTDPSAFWIWTAEGTLDVAPEGPVWARFKMIVPDGVDRIRLSAAADNRGRAAFDGPFVLDLDGFTSTRAVDLDVTPGEHSIAIYAYNDADLTAPGGNPGGILCAVHALNADGTLGALLCHTDADWRMTGYTVPPTQLVGWPLVDHLEEAQADGMLVGLTWSFTRVVDSNGNEWQQVPEVSAPVGQSLWEYLRAQAVANIDFELGADGYTLHAYRKGEAGAHVDIGFVEPADPDDPTSGNLTSLRHHGTSTVATAASVRWAGGRTEVDLTPPGARKRRVAMDFGHVEDRAEAIRMATVKLQAVNVASVQHEAGIVVRDGEWPWHDYKPGDWTPVADEDLEPGEQRVVSIAAVVQGDELVITPRFKDRVLDEAERLDAWLTAAMDGALRGDSKGLSPQVPVAPPSPPERLWSEVWHLPGSGDLPA